MSTPQHSKIINKIAREILKPIGVSRKGQSRTWLDDNGWWVIVIEFQPSAWSKGTYLNIGINWQWYPKTHFSFDLGYRELEFIQNISDTQFEHKVKEMAATAKRKIEVIRQNMSDIKTAKSYVIDASNNKPLTIWSQFHMGMICALANSPNEAVCYFQNVLESPDKQDWAIRLKEYTKELSVLVTSNHDLKTHLCNVVNESRALKKLGEWECMLP